MKHRIIIIGDVHATDEIAIYPNVNVNGKPVNLRLVALLKIFRRICKAYYVEDRKITYVLTGDVFDRKKHTGLVTTYVQKYLQVFTEEFPGHILTVPGNHDDYGDAFHHLDSINNPDFEVLDGSINSVNGFTMFGIGYKKTEEEFMDALAGFKKIEFRYRKNNFLLMHQDITGLRYDSGMKIREGVDVNRFSKKFTGVINGHLHNFQVKNPNVLCPGIIMPKKFGEGYPLFTVYDFDNFKLINKQYIRVYDIYPKVPVFITKDYNFDSVMSLNSFLKKNCKGVWGFVRIRVKIKKVQMFDIKSFKEEFLASHKNIYSLEIIPEFMDIKKKLHIYSENKLENLIQQQMQNNPLPEFSHEELLGTAEELVRS